MHGGVRGRVCRVVAYFVLPFDILPEEVHGGEGFVDDVYFALSILDRLREELPDHVLEDAWEGEGLLANLLDEELLDRIITDSEIEAIESLADEYGISARVAEEIHLEYLKNLIRYALLDGELVTRKAAQRLADERGMVIRKRVTKQLDYLVVADPHTQSNKAEKARRYGIPIIAEMEFWRRLGVEVG